MSNALAIFISGITGVLAGMSLLYLSLIHKSYYKNEIIKR